MLGITGIIILLIQFCIDGYSISTGNIAFHSFMDILGHYIFGVIGITLFLIERAAYKQRTKQLAAKLKKVRERLEEYEGY